MNPIRVKLLEDRSVPSGASTLTAADIAFYAYPVFDPSFVGPDFQYVKASCIISPNDPQRFRVVEGPYTTTLLNVPSVVPASELAALGILGTPLLDDASPVNFDWNAPTPHGIAVTDLNPSTA